jgi:hypothetical protein
MSAAVLGGHLAHVILFGGFGLAVAVVLVWPVPFDEESDGPAAADRLRPSADRAGLQAACIGLFAAAAVHVAVMPDHFRESWLYGCFFLVAAATQVAVGTLVLVRPSRRMLAAAAAGSLAVVVLWLVSRFVGVPVGPDNGAVEAVGVLDVVATAAELVTAGACLAVLAGGTLRPAWRWSTWGLALRLALLATGVGVPLVSALAPKG